MLRKTSNEKCINYVSGLPKRAFIIKCIKLPLQTFILKICKGEAAKYTSPFRFYFTLQTGTVNRTISN